MPFLEDLHAVVGHHAQLGVLDGEDVLFLERLTARDAVINYSRIAGRLPLPTSSSGLVLLAAAPPDVQERVLARPLRPLTPAGFATPGPAPGGAGRGAPQPRRCSTGTSTPTRPASPSRCATPAARWWPRCR